MVFTEGKGDLLFDAPLFRRIKAFRATAFRCVRFFVRFLRFRRLLLPSPSKKKSLETLQLQDFPIGRSGGT